jgi:hypothetical protein
MRHRRLRIRARLGPRDRAALAQSTAAATRAHRALLASGYEVIREYKKDKRDWDGNPILGQERYILRKDFQR